MKDSKIFSEYFSALKDWFLFLYLKEQNPIRTLGGNHVINKNETPQCFDAYIVHIKYNIHITNIFPKLTNSNIIGPKCFTTSRAQILCKEEISKVRNIYKYVLIE